MKHLFITFVLISIFCSCTSYNDKNSVNLFNNTTFSLLENEEIIGTEHNLTPDYLHYFDNQNVQIPLFKTIKASDYIIYIGIPYRTNISKLINFKLSGLTNNLIQVESDSISYCYKQYNKDNKHIVEFVKNENNNLVYLLGVTESKNIVDSLFNKTKLSSRIKTINND